MSASARQLVSWWDEALEALSHEPYFAAARERTAGCGLLRCRSLFSTYVRAVCGQQVSTAAAEKTARSVFAFAGFDDDRAAEPIARADAQALRALGLSQTKAQALSGLACGFVAGPLAREALARLDDAQVRDRLTALQGVGPWTADMVLIFGLNRPDVWVRTDFGLRKALEKTGLGQKDSSQWAPWRTAATWLLWQSLTSTPVQY